MKLLHRRPRGAVFRVFLRRSVVILTLLPLAATGETAPRDERFEQWMNLERERMKLDVQTEQLQAERLKLIAERERLLREIEALRRDTETLRTKLEEARTAERDAPPEGAWLVLEPATGRTEDGRDIVLGEMTLVDLLDRPSPDQLAVRHEGQRVLIPASSAAEANRVRGNLAARRDQLLAGQEVRKKQRAALEQDLEALERSPGPAREAQGETLRQRKAEWVALREEEEAARIRIDRLDRLLQRISALLEDRSAGGAPAAP